MIKYVKSGDIVEVRDGVYLTEDGELVEYYVEFPREGDFEILEVTDDFKDAFISTVKKYKIRLGPGAKVKETRSTFTSCGQIVEYVAGDPEQKEEEEEEEEEDSEQYWEDEEEEEEGCIDPIEECEEARCPLYDRFREFMFWTVCPEDRLIKEAWSKDHLTFEKEYCQTSISLFIDTKEDFDACHETYMLGFSVGEDICVSKLFGAVYEDCASIWEGHGRECTYEIVFNIAKGEKYPYWPVYDALYAWHCDPTVIADFPDKITITVEYDIEKGDGEARKGEGGPRVEFDGKVLRFTIKMPPLVSTNALYDVVKGIAKMAGVKLSECDIKRIIKIMKEAIVFML